MLFLLFINDLPNESNFKTISFADDSNLLMSRTNIQMFQSLLNQKINKVDEWLKNNKLTLNYKKKYVIVESNSN